MAELRNRRQAALAAPTEPVVRSLPEDLLATPTTANSLTSTAPSTLSTSNNETHIKIEEDADVEGQTLVIRTPPKVLSPASKVPPWKRHLTQDGWQSAALVCDMMISAATTGPRGTPTPHRRATGGLSPRKPSFKSLATPRVSAREIFDTPRHTSKDMEKSIPRISMEPESEGEPSKGKYSCGGSGGGREQESGLAVMPPSSSSSIKTEPEEDQLMGEATDASPKLGSENAVDVPPPLGKLSSATPEIEDPLAKVRSSFGLPPRAGLRESSSQD